MDPRRPEGERKILSSDASERLFARAAELDAAEKAGAEVDRLRAAAVEAGISPTAFDAALDEMHDKPAAVVRQPPTHASRMTARIIGTLGVIVAVLVYRVTGSSTPRTIDQSFTLSCLSVNDAAKLVEPVLDRKFDEFSISKNAPHVISIVATKEQMQQVSALIERQDAACATQPSNR